MRLRLVGGDWSNSLSYKEVGLLLLLPCHPACSWSCYSVRMKETFSQVRFKNSMCLKTKFNKLSPAPQYIKVIFKL